HRARLDERGELDPRDELDAVAGGRPSGVRNAVQRVVVGQGEDLDAVRRGPRDGVGGLKGAGRGRAGAGGGRGGGGATARGRGGRGRLEGRRRGRGGGGGAGRGAGTPGRAPRGGGPPPRPRYHRARMSPREKNDNARRVSPSEPGRVRGERARAGPPGPPVDGT